MSWSRRCKEGFLRSLCHFGKGPVHLPTSASCLGLLPGGGGIYLKLQVNQEAVSGHREDRKTTTIGQRGIICLRLIQLQNYCWCAGPLYFLLRFSPHPHPPSSCHSCWVSPAWMRVLMDWLLAMSLRDDSPHFPIPFHTHASFSS